MPDAQARHSLRTALAILRKAVGNTFLVTDRAIVQIHPEQHLWVDALAFQAQATEFLNADPPDASAFNFDLHEADLLTEFYDD